MIKLRGLAVGGASLALTVGAAAHARAQITTDSRSVFLAAVGNVTPEIFAGIFAFPGSSHIERRGHVIAGGDIAPGVTRSAGGARLLNDHDAGAGRFLDGVEAPFLTFDPTTRRFNNPTSILGSLVSAYSGLPSVFVIFVQPGHRGGDTQPASGAANVPAFVDLPSQAAPALATDEVTLSPLAAVTSTPEPASLTLMATGLIGLAGWTWRRKQKPAV